MATVQVVDAPLVFRVDHRYLLINGINLDLVRLPLPLVIQQLARGQVTYRQNRFLLLQLEFALHRIGSFTPAL